MELSKIRRSGVRPGTRAVAEAELRVSLDDVAAPAGRKVEALSPLRGEINSFTASAGRGCSNYCLPVIDIRTIGLL